MAGRGKPGGPTRRRTDPPAPADVPRETAGPWLVAVRQVVAGPEQRPVGRSAWWWCPGCAQAPAKDGHGTHRFAIAGEDGSLPDGPCWEFDGNLDAPTFSPSYLTWLGDRAKPTYVCHTFVRAGRIEYLGDCTHPLAGQTVDMVPLPEWLRR